MEWHKHQIWLIQLSDYSQLYRLYIDFYDDVNGPSDSDKCQRVTYVSESWICLLPLEEVWIVQQIINLTGWSLRWNIRCCLHSPHPVICGDKSVSGPDSFTACTFLPTGISQWAGAAVWRTRRTIGLLPLVFMAETNRRSTSIQLMREGGRAICEMHGWNMTLSGPGNEFREASCHF